MKGKLFCTERKAKTIIAIIYIFCLITTASRTLEYTLRFDEYCERKCDPGESPPLSENATVHHKLSHPEHTIPFPYNSNFTSIEQYNEYYQKQLKSILETCTKNPHIIYVAIFPQYLNVSTEKILGNLIGPSQLSQSKNASIIAVNKNNNVIEKPPTAQISNDTALKSSEMINNDTKHDNVSCCIPSHKVYIEDTLFGKNFGYKRFVYWYSAIVFNIIPFILIATFNCFLVKAVYKSRGMRRTMTNNSQVSQMSWVVCFVKHSMFFIFFTTKSKSENRFLYSTLNVFMK